MTNFDQDQSDKYCIFRCSGETFCMPALSVRRVVPESSVTKIPLATRTLAGLAKIQQEVLTLFSLDAIYDSSIAQAPVAASTDSKKVLIVNHDTGAWGLLIDEIETLADLEVSVCPQSTINDQPNFVVGSASYQDEFVSVIDPDNLYSILTGQLHQYWAQSTAQESVMTGTPLEINC